MKLLTINRVFFSFIVSGRLFREKWPAFINRLQLQQQIATIRQTSLKKQLIKTTVFPKIVTIGKQPYLKTLLKKSNYIHINKLYFVLVRGCKRL